MQLQFKVEELDEDALKAKKDEMDTHFKQMEFLLENFDTVVSKYRGMLH